MTDSDLTARLAQKIRTIPDFPSEGILFRDITTLLRDAGMFAAAIDHWAGMLPSGADVIVGTEARGFMLGAPLAYKLGLGFAPVRKSGKLPPETIRTAYALEYGTAEIEIGADALVPGSRVLVIDDLLATGGTAAATCSLVEKAGAEVVAVSFLLELADLPGRAALEGYRVSSVLTL